MNNEGDGDRLARGARKASFVGGFGDGELKPSVATEEEGIPDLVDNSALFAPKRPSCFYRGKPFNKRILVTQVELESHSSIILPDTAKGHSEVGRIKAFSSDSGLKEKRFWLFRWWVIRPGLKLGSLVLFDRFAAVGQIFPLLGETGETEMTLLLQEHDIEMEMEEVRQTPEPLTPKAARASKATASSAMASGITDSPNPA
jgi:co-chaperonin GroES (HSP10)